MLQKAIRRWQSTLRIIIFYIRTIIRYFQTTLYRKGKSGKGLALSNYYKENETMEKKLREMIKQAMLEKNTEKKKIFKNILETAQKSAKDKKSDVTDAMICEAAKREIKQLKELLTYVTDAKKQEVIRTNISYAESVLPQMATKEEIHSYLVSNNIEKNMGKAMKALKIQFSNAFDGQVASEAVKEYINE